MILVQFVAASALCACVSAPNAGLSPTRLPVQVQLRNVLAIVSATNHRVHYCGKWVVPLVELGGLRRWRRAGPEMCLQPRQRHPSEGHRCSREVQRPTQVSHGRKVRSIQSCAWTTQPYPALSWCLLCGFHCFREHQGLAMLV